MNWYDEFDEYAIQQANPTFVVADKPTPLVREPIRVTYEVGGVEPLHPDPEIAIRMREIGLSNCGFGCKVYADPRSAVVVLAHNRSYGCPK